MNEFRASQIALRQSGQSRGCRAASWWGDVLSSLINKKQLRPESFSAEASTNASHPSGLGIKLSVSPFKDEQRCVWNISRGCGGVGGSGGGVGWVSGGV